MKNLQKIVCIIPARLDSSRFPKKVLISLLDKPMLQWVWERAQACEVFDEIYFAVDDPITGDLVTSFGGKYILTSKECPSATDRILEIKQNQDIKADIWVNWQADEPLISKTMIQDLLQDCKNKRGIWTLKKKITHDFEIHDPHTVKVVTTNEGKALYFSRSTIPYHGTTFYKHIGIYAYSSEALDQIATMKSSFLEEAEKLEQLRYLENGLDIYVHETKEEAIGINHPDDVEKVLVYLSSSITFSK